MSDGLNGRILNLIDGQKAIYVDLLQLGHLKKDAIIAGDVRKLDTIVESEAGLLDQLVSIERQRQSLVSEQAISQGQQAGAISFRSLAFEDPSEQRRLQKLQADFSAILEQVGQVNDLNARLLTIHLDYVQEILKTATRMVDSPAYDAEGGLCLQRRQTANILNQML